MADQVRNPSGPSTLNFGGTTVTVQYWSVQRIKRNPRNARQHSAGQIRQIARSIEVNGFIVPPIVDADGQLVCGHGRFEAALKLGMNEIPVIQISHLTAEQTKAFALADNKIAMNSTWDEDELRQQLRELCALEASFPIEAIGFSPPELDFYVEDAGSTSGADPADAAPAQGPAVTRLGDLWLLNKHRLLCQSATIEGSYVTLMEDKKADAVLSDLPYNVRIQGHATVTGQHREFAQASGEMSREEFREFLASALSLLAKFSRSGALHYAFMDWRSIADLIDVGRPIYSELKCVCAWIKDRPGMGSFYRSEHEMVAVFKVGKGRHTNNIELGRHGRNRSNVWRYPGVMPFGMATDEGRLLDLHPTVKPVRMLADAILDSTKRGDIVVDTFLGSGSTLIAADKVGRTCYAMELDAGYVDVAIRRWQAWTGLQAVHAGSGKTFNELADATPEGGA